MIGYWHHHVVCPSVCVTLCIVAFGVGVQRGVARGVGGVGPDESGKIILTAILAV